MAMKHVTEYVQGLWYKLRSIGIPVDECTYIYGDNKSVLVNSSVPHSQLKKKSNSVAFYHVREGSALDKWRITYINTHDNVADLMIKNLPSGEKRTKFCKMLLHYLTPSVEVETFNKHAAAAAVRVLLGEWIEAIIGALKCWDTESRNEV